MMMNSVCEVPCVYVRIGRSQFCGRRVSLFRIRGDWPVWLTSLKFDRIGKFGQWEIVMVAATHSGANIRRGVKNQELITSGQGVPSAQDNRFTI